MRDLTDGAREGRRRSVALVAVVLGLALVQRCVTMVMVARGVEESTLVSALMQYDSGWYRRIVEQGYHLAGQAGLETSSLAFFPLYPGTARVVTVLTGASATSALLILAFIGSVVAAWPIFLVGRHLHSAPVGLVLALLWGASPQSFVLVMGYPEGWFTAATAWALLSMLQRRPISAGIAVAAAGLLRPSAIPLVLVVMIWCALQWRRDVDHSPRWLAAAVIAPLGVGSFMAYTAWRMGEVFAYFTVQRQWNLQMGAPWAFWRQAIAQLTSSNDLLVSIDLYVPILVGYVALLVLLLGRWKEPGHAWLVLYSLLASLLILARTTYFWSESRQFLPLFPLLLPLATIRTSPWAWAVVLSFLTLAAGAFGGAFLSALQYSP